MVLPETEGCERALVAEGYANTHFNFKFFAFLEFKFDLAYLEFSLSYPHSIYEFFWLNFIGLLLDLQKFGSGKLAETFPPVMYSEIPTFSSSLRPSACEDITPFNVLKI